MKTTIKSLLAGAALAVILTAGFAGTAKADHDDHYDHGWHRGHEWREHEHYNHAWYVAHPHYVPGYVVAPPPVVYAPPPEPAGINLILPLNFH